MPSPSRRRRAASPSKPRGRGRSPPAKRARSAGPKKAALQWQRLPARGDELVSVRGPKAGAAVVDAVFRFTLLDGRPLTDSELRATVAPAAAFAAAVHTSAHVATRVAGGRVHVMFPLPRGFADADAWAMDDDELTLSLIADPDDDGNAPVTRGGKKLLWKGQLDMVATKSLA